MPASVDAIIQAAREQWALWGHSTWDLVRDEKNIVHTDDEADFAQLVIDRYCSVGGGNPSVHAIANDEYYWSAVGISAAMSFAGYKKHEFPFAESHSRFIRYFVAARKAGAADAAYWGYRLNELGGEPRPGDLVAYARGAGMTPDKAASRFDATQRYDSHSDIVVACREDEIDVIGFNVLDSVTMKTLKLGDNGHIVDSHHHWFATLKRRS